MTGELTPALIAMSLLLTKHCLFDFVFQTRFQRENKARYGHPGGLLHCLLHSAGTFAVFLVITPSAATGALILLAEFAAHYHVDWFKARLLRAAGWTQADPAYWRVFGVDQLIHGLTYVAIAWTLIFCV